MSDLAVSIEMHESKSIDRSRFCQIQWSDNGQTVEKKNSEADQQTIPPNVLARADKVIK